MDYSFLLVTEKVPLEMQNDKFIDNKMNRNLKISIDKQEFYHLGIIDYLQAWNWNKKGEALIKTYIKGKDRNKISAVEPIYYQKRFYDFMKNKVLLDNSTQYQDRQSFKLSIEDMFQLHESSNNNEDDDTYKEVFLEKIDESLK